MESQSVGLDHYPFGSGMMLSAGAALLPRTSLELEGRELDEKPGGCRIRVRGARKGRRG